MKEKNHLSRDKQCKGGLKGWRGSRKEVSGRDLSCKGLGLVLEEDMP